MTSPNEPGVGLRTSGLMRSTDVGLTKRIWDGPPPVWPDGVMFRVLAISAEVPAASGQTVSIRVEAGSPKGGFTAREFNVGGGLIAILKVGNYPHVRAVVTTVIPAGMVVRWAWSEDPGMQPTPLFARLSYLVANAITVLPQGTETIFAQNACVVTWQLAQYAATFPQALAAGMPLPALWGSFASNIAPNQFIFQMKGF